MHAPTPHATAAPVTEIVACPFCGGSATRPLTGQLADEESAHLDEPFGSLRFQFVACTACDTAYLRERPAADQIWRFYQGEYCCYQPLDARGPIIRALVDVTTRLQLRTLRRLMPPGSDLMVDYGCGIGTWLRLLRQAGAPWRLLGTEVSEDLVARARAQGIEAVVADEHTLGRHVAAGSAGIINLHHVIEHVPDPLALFAALREALAPGGVVIGQTPDRASLEARLFGDLWPQWHVPRHLVLFDPPTMRRFAERAGFEVVRIAGSPSGATQWSGGTLRALARWRGRPFRGIHEPLYPALMLAFAPLSVAQSLVGSTSHMDFILRKPAAPPAVAVGGGAAREP
ncbi:MAG: class I SAM-dependent methyltransferase, partial [Deltaproteobacteria bacterium]|nr:class I SAM-dependent methyltransferase [Deltaproteobacteria bacterium]